MSGSRRTVGHRTRRADGDSFASRLAAILDVREMTITELQGRLARRGHRVSLATLSYWRSGQRQPERAASFDVVTEVEEILGLPRGRLTDAIGPSRRSGVIAPEAPVWDLVQMSPGLVDAVASLGFEDVLPGLVEESVHVVFDVDDRGRDRHCRVRVVYRATEADVQRLALFLVTDEPHGLLPVFGAVAGCTLGRAVAEVERGIYVHEALLDRPLRVGETCVVEYGIALPWSAPRLPMYEHHLVRRVDELVIWVRFDESRRPRSAAVYERGLGQSERSSAVDVEGSGSIHLRLVRFGPGRAGVSWNW